MKKGERFATMSSKRIPLDLSIASDLKWDLSAAENAEEIMWDLDFGRFDPSNEAEMRTFQLAMDHFYDVVWIPFSEKSRGVNFYRGKIPFEPFGRNLTAEFLERMAGNYPAFLTIDASSMQDPLECAEYLHPDLFHSFEIELLNAPIYPNKEAPVGVCLPTEKSPRILREVFGAFHEMNIDYRIVSEETLISCWHGLDELIFPVDSLNPMAFRKLQGFCAAGGLVIPFPDKELGLANEMPFREWRACKLSASSAS